MRSYVWVACAAALLPALIAPMQSARAQDIATTPDWNDEFDGTSIDTSKWTAADFPSPRNGEIQYYRPGNVYVQGGQLSIKSEQQNFNGSNYISGQLYSEGKKSFRFGRFEIRARIPKNQGIHNSLWLLGNGCSINSNASNCSWPGPGAEEIDILETFNGGTNQYSVGGHAGPAVDVNNPQSCTIGTPDLSSAFNNFEVEWYPGGTLVFYFNGVEKCRKTFPNNYNSPLYYILDTTVGGVTGNPDGSSSWPQLLEIDYVRHYPLTSSPGNVVDGGFEIGRAGPWTLYGTSSVVSSGFQNGSHALRLVGGSTGAEQTVVGLTPNTSYTLTASTRMSTVGENVYIGAKNFGGSEVSALVSNNSYAANSVSFTTGSNSTTASVYLYKGGGSGDAYVDDVTLTTGGGAPSSGGTNVIGNPSFDVDTSYTQTPAQWSTWGPNPEADGADANGPGRTGNLRGVHWADHSYTVYTYQAKSGLPNGTYRVRAYVQSTGGQNTAAMNAKTVGGSQTASVAIPAASGWTLVEINNVAVTDGTLEVGFYSIASAYQWILFDDVEAIKQ